MARSTDINQRIVLSGAEEVRRHLESIAASGQRAGNQTRAALVAATSGANSFTAGTRSASASSGQMRFALQNLSFQVNDVATSLASGGDVMRVFAQQGGQIFQVFQQGGGARAVFGGAAAAIGSMITPMTAAAAAAVALAAGLALVIARAVSSEGSARQFDVTLQGIGKSSKISGKELEDAAQRLRKVGLAADESRQLISQGLAEGIDPTKLERIIAVGADVEATLGKSAVSVEQFVSAVAKGGAPLQDIARKLNLTTQSASELEATLKQAAGTIGESSTAIADALASRAEQIVDAQRDAARRMEDITRQRLQSEEDLTRQSAERIKDISRDKGSNEVDIAREAAKQKLEIGRQSSRAEEENALSLTRRLQDINRQSNRQINELLLQRTRENARVLKAHNERILADAQKALDTGAGLFAQIEARVLGANVRVLGPAALAFRNLAIAWNTFINSLANSAVIQATVQALSGMVTFIAQLQSSTGIPGIVLAVAVAVPALIALRAAVVALTVAAASNPLILVATAVAAIGVAIVTYWPQISAFFTNLLMWFDTLPLRLQRAGESMGGIFGGIVKIIGDNLAVIRNLLTGDFAGAFEEWKTMWKDVLTLIFETMLDAAFEFAKRKLTEFGNYMIGVAKSIAAQIANTISSAFGGAGGGGGGGNTTLSGGQIVPAGASGGMVRGPGTGTSDSILTRLSNGEFVVNALATRMNLPILQAINSMRMPTMPRFRLPSGFATGGMVAAGAGGGSAVYLTFPSGATVGPMMSDRQVFQAVEREAKKAGMRRAGKLPSTA